MAMKRTVAFGARRLSSHRLGPGAAAMGQRGSLQKAPGQARGGGVTVAMMREFKGAVAEVLTPHATAGSVSSADALA